MPIKYWWMGCQECGHKALFREGGLWFKCVCGWTAKLVDGRKEPGGHPILVYDGGKQVHPEPKVTTHEEVVEPSS